MNDNSTSASTSGEYEKMPQVGAATLPPGVTQRDVARTAGASRADGSWLEEEDPYERMFEQATEQHE